MGEYITSGTVFPNYYQFPEFLLWEPISQTAKLTYMILYDRARLSQKNDWNVEGKIYTVYPIADLAETLGKSESTIKAILNELDEAGLLIRKSGGFAKANKLYVLIPRFSLFSDKVRKSDLVECKNKTCGSRISRPTGGSLSTPSKVIETNNINQNKEVIQPTAFGKYKNIFLADKEYQQLKADYPYRIDDLIEEMSSYMAATGKEYQNYEAALRSWAEREKKEKKSAGPKPGFPDYSFEPGESF